MNDDRLSQLLDRYLDVRITDHEQSALESELLASADASERFWNQIQFHAFLRRYAEERCGAQLAGASAAVLNGEASAATASDAAMSDSAASDGSGPDVTVPDAASSDPSPATSGAAATVLSFLGDSFGSLLRPVVILSVLAVTAYYSVMLLLIWGARSKVVTEHAANPVPRPAASSIASLTNKRKAEWSGGSKTPKLGDMLPPGKLTLSSGFVEFGLAGGVQVIVEGPASFEIRDARCVFLQGGKLAARVPPQAVGFRVATPTAEVVDLGTEFGVEVDAAGATKVQVFRGAVEMSAVAKGQSPAANHSPAKRRLVAGQAARILASDPTHLETVAGDADSIVRQLPKEFELSDCSIYTQYVIRQTHPVLYWHFDEGAADTTKDAVAGRFPDVWFPLDTGLSGPSPADGFGGMDARNLAVAVKRFRAIGSEHVDNAPRVPVENYSLQCWFNCSTPFNAQQLYYLLGRGNVGRRPDDVRDSVAVVGQFRQPGIQMGQLVFYDGNGPVGQVIGGDVSIEPGRWYQLIFVREGHKVRVYLDGALKIAAQSTWQGGDGPILNFGHRVDTDFEMGHTGRIDEVAVWDRALGEQEVRELWQAAGRQQSAPKIESQ